MCSATTQKYEYQVPSLSPQIMYAGSNGLTRNYITSSSIKQPHIPIQTVVLTSSILLCIFSSLLSITLSYRWYVDTNRQIDLLINEVKGVGHDLSTCTNLIKKELETKRENSNNKHTKFYGNDYEDLDEVDEDDEDRFMGMNLLDNNSPAKTYQAKESNNPNNRERRNAEIVATQIIKNELNSSINEKSGVQLVQEETNEENTVKINRRKAKKMGNAKKKQEEGDSLEDFKETQEITAAHFTSNSSNYNMRTHAIYSGNGRVEHPDGDYRDWTANYWDLNRNVHRDVNLNHNANYFIMKNGTVEINKPGLYFVYAQIHYSDTHDMNGYSIKKNDENVLRCTVTRHNATHSDSCFTGGLIYFNTKDILSIKGLDKNRVIILEPTRSFFGLYKVSNDNKR